MQSFWDYLRLRSRDSVLAGLQDAIDVVEGDGRNNKDQEAARRFLDRHAPEKSPAPTIEGETAARVVPLESAEALEDGGNPTVPDDRSSGNTLAARISEQMKNDVQKPDAFERRLEQTNPANGNSEAMTTPRKRGRPRKNP